MKLKKLCIGHVLLSFLLLLPPITGSANAEITGPGWFTQSAEPLSLEEFNNLKNAQPSESQTASDIGATNQLLVPTQLDQTIMGIGSATSPSQEIKELARALQYDPKLIYDFVHNHIDYVPYFGSLKGAHLTYLDGSGNDIDQASLLIALLRESGYIAQFVYGQMTIPGEQLSNWLGVDLNSNVISKIISSGGTDVTVLSSDGTCKLDRVWVKANIDGTDYVFDPAFKSYEYTPKIDIASALGYNRADLLAAASSGATITTDYVQNLNEVNLSSKLVEYASNFVTTMRSQYPNSHLEEIVGGRSITKFNLNQYQTTLPFVTENDVVWDEVPADKHTTLRIQHVGIDHTFYIPEIAGKRLTLTYAGGDYHPEIRLEGALVASGGATTAGTKNNFILTIDHPYSYSGGTYVDQTSTYNLESGATYAIVSNFGGASDDLLSSRQRALDKYLADGLADTSEAVLGESLNIMGLTWMKEWLLASRVLAELAETVSFRHHSIGVMAQEAGYYIDVKTSVGTTVSKHNNSADVTACFNVDAAIGSAFEHGVLEQLMGSDNPGISTMKLLQIANSNGNKIFYADQSNYAAIRPQLINYSTAKLDEFQSKVNSGYTLILPENGQMGLGTGTWQGNGYITRYVSGNSMVLGMKIGGDYYGGYASTPAQTQPPVVNFNTQISTIHMSSPKTIYRKPTPAPTFTSKDPVDLASGNFVYDRVDLALGGGSPMGLAFARSYNSGQNLEDRGLGNGWLHNYDIHISRTSHGEPGLGTRQPIDAAAMITAMYINLDLMRNQDDLQGWVISALNNKWVVDQLINNAITVHIGSKVMEFIELPDGTYAAPPSINAELLDNGNNTFSLLERFGTRLDFNTDDKISQCSDVDGNTMSFTYTGGNLSSVQDAFGRSLTLTYTGAQLTSVADSSGRSVSYGFDANGDLVSYTDPENKVWGYAYDANHRMTSLTNALNVTTATNTYDTLGRVNTQTVPRQSGVDVTYNFYFSGFRNIEEDPAGNQTIYYYDEKGRSIGNGNALGHKTTRKYDGQFHIVEATDARANTSASSYDGNNNLIKITNAKLEETTYTYDSLYRLTRVTDPLLHSIDYGYDAEHHLVKTTIFPSAGEQIVTSSTYYADGLLHTATDGRSTVTTLVYDSNGNPYTSKVSSHPQVLYDYDPIGRLISLTDQEGSQTIFAYDDRGLITSKTDPLGRTTSYTYYDDGNLHTKTDRNNNTISYAWTASNKMDTITYPDNSTVSFVYNDLDRLTSMTDAVGTTLYSQYDAEGRLLSVTDPHGFAISYTYDEVGNIWTITYPGNKTVTYSYDALNRLESVDNWLGQRASYVYDAAGRLKRVTTFNGIVTNYGYDDANRLTQVSSPVASYTFTTLDPNGNPTGVTRDEPLPPIMPTSVTDLTYNPERNRLLAAGAESFSYDDEGRLATGYGVNYSFDYEHRLVGVGADIQYSYDGIGNRLQAVRNGVTTRYIYDLNGNLLAEADGNNTIRRYYIHGLGLLAMVTPANDLYCYHFNTTGSTVAMTDMTGAMVNKYAYTPFGTVANAEESLPQPFKFVGQYGVMTEPNNFYYMRARYYDPQVRRFISEDPSGFGGGDVNLYAYVGNNPILFVDPSGLISWKKVGLGALEAGAGAAGIVAAAYAEVGSGGAATAVAVSIAAFSAPAFAHGITEIVAGFMENDKVAIPTIPPVSGPAIATLATTGDVGRAQEIDLISSAIMLGKGVGSWAAKAPSTLETISVGAEFLNLAGQSMSMSPQGKRY